MGNMKQSSCYLKQNTSYYAATIGPRATAEHWSKNKATMKPRDLIVKEDLKYNYMDFLLDVFSYKQNKARSRENVTGC